MTNLQDESTMFAEFEKDFSSLTKYEKWFTTLFNLLLYLNDNYVGNSEDNALIPIAIDMWARQNIPTSQMSIDLMKRNIQKGIPSFHAVLVTIEKQELERSQNAQELARNLMRDLGMYDVDGVCRRRWGGEK